MKLKEAIEILKDPDGNMKGHLSPSYSEAIQLLIEAGKRVQELRIDNPETAWQLLPGETTD